jgi:hypothetical protein
VESYDILLGPTKPDHFYGRRDHQLHGSR